MTTIIHPTEDYGASYDFDLPFDGIEYLNFFDRADVLTRNLVPGKPRPQVVGTPVFGDGYWSMHGLANYLATRITETHHLTYISVARGVNVNAEDLTSRPIYIGNFSNANPGASLFARTATAVTGAANTDSGGGTSAIRQLDVVDDPNQWGIRAVRIASGLMTVENATTGEKDTLALEYPRLLSPNRILVGSSYSTQFQGLNDQFAAMIVSRPISDAELTAMVTIMRNRAARSELDV